MTVSIGYEIEEGINQLAFHTHSTFEIYMLLEGECTFQIGDRFFELQPDDILLINGLTLHKAFVSEESGAYKRTVVHFEQADITPLLQSIDAEHVLTLFSGERGYLYRLKNPENKERIQTYMRELDRLQHVKKSQNVQSQSLLILTQILLEIDSSNLKSPKITNQRDIKITHAESIARFMTLQFKERIDIATISNATNLSQSYLSHVFKEVTGMTVMTFLMSYRLSQAMYLLRLRQELQINKIAKEAGFESNAHFSRFFKKHVGQTPLQYRKANG
ncbi:AraC family transcriptional regulator [Aerococcus agrisoli]|uniref:AraC family transcriptional regulator n=1 Tax=Aerococcus agrisoli TaxID=2487350 RepID=A0A3N4G2W4_9LACT|nr:AraC family transcriptional regulator [Aerococcus agrisoli]RPA57273.1 AraC family transcriptional regulator [Aerococcus agrisoli]